MRSGILAVFLCAILSGCASSQAVRPGQVPSAPSAAATGGTEHVISCSFLNWAHCYERAQQLCPGQYKVLSESEGVVRRELRIVCPGGG